MSKVIRGGTVVTAEGTRVADVLVEGERIAAIGRGADGRRGGGCLRRLRDAGRDRPARASGDAVHGDLLDRRLLHRDGGGGVGGDDDGGGLLHPGAGRVDAGGLGGLGGEVARQGGRGLCLAHVRDRVERALLRRDGGGGAAGGQYLQALHGLQGRADGERRRDVRVVLAAARRSGRCRWCMPRTATWWRRCRRSCSPRG